MKAIVLEEASGAPRLTVRDRPIPDPRRQEVVLRMLAASLNYRDLEIAQGRYHTTFTLPLVPLSDGVGEVVAVGEDVARVAVGDRVCTTFWQRWVGGGFHMAEPKSQRGGPLGGVAAEYVLVDEQALVHAPPHLTDQEAATLPCAGVTAFHALVSLGSIKAGETVLVQGTGGVAVFGLQFATMAGARAIIISSSDQKLARARELGAWAGVNYRSRPDWASEVMSLTEGRGVDHVLELGGPTTFAQSLRSIRPGGQLNVIGYLGGVAGQVNPLDIFRRQATVRGIPVGSRETFEDMARAIEISRMRPVVDKVFSWLRISDALSHLQSASHFGKIALDFSI